MAPTATATATPVQVWGITDIATGRTLGTVENKTERGARLAAVKAFNVAFKFTAARVQEAPMVEAVQAAPIDTDVSTRMAADADALANVATVWADDVAAVATLPGEVAPLTADTYTVQCECGWPGWSDDALAFHRSLAHPVTGVERATFTPDANAWFFPEDGTEDQPEAIAPVATPTATIMHALDSALSAIQHTHPEVPSALAVVISTGRGKVHGHFEANSWADTDGEHKGSARHEILIASESLGLGAEQVLTTLIHEAAHAVAHAGNVADTSRQGRWHNRKFEATASAMGLLTEKSPQTGYATPGLNTWALAHYADTLANLTAVLTTHRRPVTKPKAPKTTIKIACECEGSAVTVPIKWADTFAPAMVCTDCDATLAPVE